VSRSGKAAAQFSRKSALYVAVLVSFQVLYESPTRRQ
jgi:hypothetical protein